jgi:hypothetical protein
MSAALSTLKRDEVARATSGLNVLLRLGGSVGTALAAVLLTSQLSTRLPSSGSEPSALSTARNLSPAARSLMLQGLAEAFAHTFVWGFVVLVLAMIAASFLPRKGLTRLRRRAPLTEWTDRHDKTGAKDNPMRLRIITTPILLTGAAASLDKESLRCLHSTI